MKKSSFIILISVLVILIGVNVFLIVKNTSCCSGDCCSADKKEHKDYHHYFMVEKLKLSASQQTQYEQIRDKSHKEGRVIFSQMQKNQEVLAEYLTSNQNNSKVIDSLENLIANNQKQLLHCHVMQYQELKTILQPQQKAVFDSVFKDVCVWGRRYRANFK